MLSSGTYLVWWRSRGYPSPICAICQVNVDAKIKWLPNKDSNLDKLSQSQLCYRYTIRQ
jgi:hypothetical protein